MRRLPADRVVVYAPAWPGAAAFDAAQRFRVVRHPGRTMLPTPDVLRRTVALVREVRPDLICFGAAFPLGLLAGRITRATGVPCAGFTHGVEVAVGRVPLASRLLVRVAGQLRLLTAVSHWSAAGCGGRCAAAARSSCSRPGSTPPPTTAVTGGRCASGTARVGPVCVCISRLVPRKGQTARPGLAGCGQGAGGAAAAGRGGRTRGGCAGWPRPARSPADPPGRRGPGRSCRPTTPPGRVRHAVPYPVAGADLEALGVVFLEAAATGCRWWPGVRAAPRDVVRGRPGRWSTGAGRAVADASPAAGRPGPCGPWARPAARVEAEFAWGAVVARLEQLLAEAAAGAAR